MKTAAAYIRVSTGEQTEFSPESQLKAIRKYAKEHDMILPEEFIYTDEGISGRKAEKRPAFQQMIGTAKLKPRPFDVILLCKFSRFARNREDSIVYKSMLRKQCGIDVISVSEQIGEDKTSILIEALIEAMDEYYSLNLAEEVKRGMMEKFSRGGVVSQPPFGYSMKDGIFSPDNNAETVRMIFNDYLSGMGTRAIARKLNELGLCTTKGHNFENRTVEYILTNPVYIGKLRRSKNGREPSDRFHQSEENTIIIDGSHTPIIDSDTFERVQEKVALTKKHYPKYSRQAPVEFMLKGLVRCSNCGATLTMQARNNGLQCHNYSRGACKVSHFIKLEKLNSLITDKIKSDFENDFFDVEIKITSQDNDNHNQNIASAVAREEKKLQRIHEAYEAGIDTLDEYKERKEKIQSAIDRLKKQIKADIPEKSNAELLKDKVNECMEFIDSSESSENLKNNMLRSFIEKIIFVRRSGTVEIYYRV
ncbi:MAG: recombinase family protein [Ruminococcus sp.]|nr:recombinase family protein [Ruminococcus sp.]